MLIDKLKIAREAAPEAGMVGEKNPVHVDLFWAHLLPIQAAAGEIGTST